MAHWVKLTEHYRGTGHGARENHCWVNMDQALYMSRKPNPQAKSGDPQLDYPFITEIFLTTDTELVLERPEDIMAGKYNVDVPTSAPAPEPKGEPKSKDAGIES